MPVAESRAARGDKFTAVLAAIVARLPFGLARVVPPSFLGFAVINSFTFGVDLALLYVLHGVLDLMLPLSITIAYAAAFSLSFVLNRAFNFRSHAPAGKQFAVYVVVAVINYLAWILGVGSVLAALGLDYRLARLVAGACEAVYMYTAMRWIVFRSAQAAPAGP